MGWIRSVYLYLFALLGLVLVTIGSVQLVGLGLRSWVLTAADAEVRLRAMPEPPLRLAPRELEILQADSTLDPQVRAALRSWAEDYERIRAEREQLDPVEARRQREAAEALALLLVGIPLYLYHWRTIRRERGGQFADHPVEARAGPGPGSGPGSPGSSLSADHDL